MAFQSGGVLDKKFYTVGAFYRIELEGESYTCRGLAKICRHGIETDVADALIVMVNPGSCKPTDREYSFPPYNGNLREIPMVAARSDQTQHQLMRLMECRGWNMIFIINLSDLRAGKISDFREKLKRFREKENDTHSIFSPGRIKQINSLLNEKTRVIVGWGVNSVKVEKMKEALSILIRERRIFGVPHQIHPYYLHPKPALIGKRIEWLENMNRILNEAEGVDGKVIQCKSEKC